MADIKSLLEAKGWEPHQAAGIVANLKAESGLNPSAINPDGGAYGLAQWRGSRQSDFAAFAGKPLQGSSLEEQVNFLHHELTSGKEQAAGRAIKASVTAQQAGLTASRLYERHGNPEEDARRGQLAAKMVGEEPIAAGFAQAVKLSMQQPAVRSTPAQLERSDAAFRDSVRFAEEAQLPEPSLPAVWGAAIEGATTSRLFDPLNEIVQHVFTDRPIDQYDPTFKIPQKELDNATADTLQELLEIKNPLAYAKYVQDRGDEELRIKTLMGKGIGTGIAVSFLAELTDPVNLLTAGVAGMRATAAAAKAASLGQKYNVIASAIAENLVSGTAVEGAIQLANQKLDVNSLLLSLTADTVLGGAAGAWAKRGAKGVDDLQRAMEHKILADARTLDKAKANLGSSATPDDLAKEFDRVRLEEVRSPVVQAVSPSQQSERLMAHPDEADALSEIVPNVQQAAPTLQGPELATVPVKQAISEALTSPALAKVDSTTKATRHLLMHFQKTLPASVMDTPVNFAGNVRGKYDPISNTVETPGKSGTTLSPDGRNDATILAHEVTHAATSRMIYAVQEGLAGVSPTAKAAVQRLEEIRLELDTFLRKTGIQQRGRKAGADYAASDLHEFVAQVMSDNETRETLAKMPGGQFKDMLSAFADAVVRLLGLDPKTNKTALKEAVALVESVIKEGAPANIPISAYFQSKPGLAPKATSKATASVEEFLTNPDAQRFNLTGLPLATPADRADAKAMLELRLKAEAWGKENPRDEAWMKRAANLADNDTFNVASTGLIMLKSEDDLTRMLAHMLLEDASGVAGKRPKNSAAISKDALHKLFLGNTTNDIQDAFTLWAKTRGGSLKDDFLDGGKLHKKFNDAVSAEIEYRAFNGRASNTDEHIEKAIVSAHAAYERMRKAQIEHKTLGWAAMPTEEVWYMPHVMSPAKVRNLTPKETDILRSALTDQYQSIEGWDISFSDRLSAAVVAKTRARATGGFDTPLGGNNPGSAQIIEDALVSMNMTTDEVRKLMKQYSKGAANFTKSRTKLDLNREYDIDGKPFKLLDIYETDQITLLRSQAGRVSGEVALAQQGIYGKPGMALLRKTMAHNARGERSDHELRSFDQIAAEFMNEPFGTQASKLTARLTAGTSLLRLGGIAYAQFSEFIQGVFHVGAGRTLSSISSIPRLRREIIDLAAGKKVNNPLLASMETFAGEFGTYSYKIVLPFDAVDNAYPTYGQDTLTMFDRLLRGGSYLQSKLSGWRAIHSAQQRGMAEQIVSKMAKYVRDGTDDVALEQMGISKALSATMKADLSKVAKFDSSGNLIEFDITGFTDPEVATQVWQAVKRGTHQIIQGTYIGETGKWAHDGYLKMLTQFRTFSITSMEKQWGRQRNSRGAWEAFGMVMGAMSLAMPIHVARVYANSIGREDRDEYLEKNLAIERLVRASMNYVAAAGMLPDMIDMSIAIAPQEIIQEKTGVVLSGVTGGRVGQTGNINSLIPALGTANDVWGVIQNMGDIDSWERITPMNRHPLLIPITNALGD